MADAIQGLEDCDDLEVIESKTHGCSNGTVINSLSDDKGGVAATNLLEFRKAEPFTSKKVKEKLSSSKTRKANSTNESICDNFSTDASDIEMFDVIDNHNTGSVSMQRNAQSRNPELQCRSSANTEDASIVSGAGEQKLLQLTMWF